jgi:SAM-dependent methyltransferase
LGVTSDTDPTDAYRADAYGDVWADFLDEWTAMTGSEPDAAMLDRLVELAAGSPGRRVLELGIGTGFAALPLAARGAPRGVTVEGVDGSPRMLELLAAKPGGDAVRTYLCDMADLRVDGHYDVVTLTSSSLFCLPDQSAQVRCFAAVERVLAPGGTFALATYVHDPRWFTKGVLDTVQAEGEGWVMRWHAENDPSAQVTSVVRTLERDGEPVRRFPHRERYATPAEMDLMARLAGLRLAERWKDWTGAPFTGRGHAVSLYRRE